MHDPDEFLQSYFNRVEPSGQNLHEDIELAFRLQNASQNDPDLPGRLVHLYAQKLYKWVGILLYYRKMDNPTREEILSVLKMVFENAVDHVEQFHGIESITGWLFGIGYQLVRQNRGTNWSGIFLNEINHEANKDGLSPYQRSAYWDSMDCLPEKLRSTLILRYLFDFGLPEIANILNLPEQDVHRRLIAGRERLLVIPIKSHMDLQIHSYADGLLNDKPDELNHLRQHLETCGLCQTMVLKINGLEKTLSESMKIRWVFSPLNDGETDSLLRSIVNAINRPQSKWKVQIRLRHAVWILGLALTFIGMSSVLLRFTTLDAELQQPAVKPTQQLLPIVELRPKIATPQTSKDKSNAPQYIEPAFSSDGKWAVFASLKSIPTPWGQYFPTIEVYNRVANTIQVISESTSPSDKLWIWWDLAPSISGDGHWIAFVSATNDPNAKGIPCKTTDQNACLDVFLYDRETGSTRRLTQAVNGGPSDGDSLAPTVSEDGKWVAFWSTADNLVNGFTNKCQQSETNVICLYIYIYNLDTGNIDWIPIPTGAGDPVFGVDKISLSADGRLVGFTVTPTAQVGTPSTGILSAPNTLEKSTDGTLINIPIPDITHRSEAIVYDRNTGKYELENQAQDGIPGDGESSSPVLSADGRYVAFTSDSTNIVAGDTNKSSDVFLRDRINGKVELISVSSNGWKGRSDSGFTSWGRGYFSINLSPDGRYIVFESTATNLGQDLNSGCNKIDLSNCIYLYIHDRQTGSTEWISALPDYDSTLFPEISADGRWVSFMQTLLNCNSTQILCSDVMLYDRQRGWMTNLTKFNGESPLLPWSFSSRLKIPWQAWESTTLAISPDSKQIALGGTDSEVRIWKIPDRNHSLINGDPVAVLETKGSDQFSALTFSPNGEWFAAGTTNGTVYIWKLPGGELLYTSKDQSGVIKKLVFSQGDEYLVISTVEASWIYRISDNQLSKVNSITYGIKVAFAIDIAPNGNMLATSLDDGSVLLQNLPSGKIIGRFNSNQLDVSSLAFSDDGSLLASRSTDATIDIWQIGAADSTTASITLINTIQSYGYEGILALSPDNKYLASADMNGGVTFWSVPDGNIFAPSTSLPIGMVNSLAFSKDGEKVASMIENEIILWGLHPDRSSLYYDHSGANTYVDSKPVPGPTASDIPVFQPSDNSAIEGNLNLKQAAASVTFPLLIPNHLPENINFVSASVNNDGSILLRYDANDPELYQATFYIYEKSIGNSVPPTMTIGADADVILTQVETISGSVPAEYVQGDWTWRQSFTPPPDGSTNGVTHDVWDWDSSSTTQRLRWRQNDILIGLYYQVYKPYSPIMYTSIESDKLIDLSSVLYQGDLLQIASGMMPLSKMSFGPASLK
jgi:WD40 repeat protein/DNA-directed RNA polymerase specialized sigma24 family protein